MEQTELNANTIECLKMIVITERQQKENEKKFFEEIKSIIILINNLYIKLLLGSFIVGNNFKCSLKKKLNVAQHINFNILKTKCKK